MRLKQVLAAGLSIVTLFSLAACGNSNSASSDGKTEITLWHNSTTGDGKAYWQSAADAFMEDHPNVSIKIEPIQNEDMDGKLQTALQDPNSAPDIFMSRGGKKLRDMVEAGQLMDISDKVSDTVKTQMKSALSAESVDGKLYAVPQSVLPGGMWYSQDLFTQAGVSQTPTNWDEFKTAAVQIKDAGITPIALGGKDAWPAAHWWYWFALRECPTKVFDAATTKGDFSDGCWIKAGEDVEELLKLDVFNEGFLTTPAQQGAGSSAGLIANHMASMELMGGWDPGVIRDLTPDGKDLADLGFFPFPAVENGKGDATAVMGGVDALAVGQWAPEEAVEFLNFVSEKDWQEKYAKAFSTIPASKEAQDAVTSSALKGALEAYNNASYVTIWLDTVFGQNVGNALNEGVVNMMAGKGTPQDVVKTIEDAAAKG